MVINTNVQAQIAANNLSVSSAFLSRSLARLSSGSKIVQPSDDAAGLAVSMRLDAQIGRLDAAKSDVGNATSFTQTQDGFLKKIGAALSRMSELSMMSLDITKSDADRALYQLEVVQLEGYISNASNKGFNGVSLFSGSTLAVVIDSEGGSFAMAGTDLGTATYTTALGSSVATTALANTARGNIELAITQLAGDRALIGASQTRLNFTSEQLSITKENTMAANSRIKDIDIAEETTQFARYSILVQAGTSMLAQANAVPQTVLRLLQ